MTLDSSPPPPPPPPAASTSSSSSSSSPNAYPYAYTYHEHIWLVDDEASKSSSMRVELQMKWPGDDQNQNQNQNQNHGMISIHPFDKVITALFPSFTSHENNHDANHDANHEDEDDDIQVTMSLASRPSQYWSSSIATSNSSSSSSLSLSLSLSSLSSTLLAQIPIGGGTISNDDDDGDDDDATTTTTTTATTTWPQFPSGFWLTLASSRRFTELELTKWLHHWTDHRVVTTPLRDSTWDIYHTDSSSNTDTKIKTTTNTNTIISKSTRQYHHQLFLPTTGAAWSADALSQFFKQLLPDDCHLGKFGGVSAMEWSQWLVTGQYAHTQQWLQFSKTHATVGVQLLGGDGASSLRIPAVLMSDQASCPLATRTVERMKDQPTQLPNKHHPRHHQEATLEQVIRHPTSPIQGRLETWLSYTPTSSSTTSNDGHNGIDCHWQIRQRLPFYMIPSWQTLEVVSSDASATTTSHVEWNSQDDDDDLSSVLIVTSRSGARLGTTPNYSSSSSSTTTTTTTTTVLMISLDYEPAFLSMDDFPGDPNRGRELYPAVATWMCHDPTGTRGHSTGTATGHPTTTTTTPVFSLYSNSLLLLPPVPDMSMPFNVLSLTCSLYAYLIGTLLTLLVKRSSDRIRYKLHPDQVPKSKVTQLKEKLRTKLKKVLGRSVTATIANDSSLTMETPEDDKTTSATATTTTTNAVTTPSSDKEDAAPNQGILSTKGGDTSQDTSVYSC